MSHKIENTDGVAYAGETPWHGIGKQVSDLMTASEAILHSGLDWKIKPIEIFDGNGQVINGFKAIQREDTGTVFQVASDRYTPIQNVDCFQVFDEVTKTGQAKYEVVGSLQGGRKIWILARIPSLDFGVKGKDEIRAYLLLTTSHDGTLSLQMFKTPIRVVCWNTLSCALQGREKGKVAYFKHTVNYRSKINLASDILADTVAYFKQFKEVSEGLARKEMLSLEVDSFLDTLLNLDNLKKDDIPTRSLNVKEDLTRLFVSGKGNAVEGIRGTRWAMYNAVTEYIDHERTTKGDDSNRLASSWFGSGGDLREKAFAILTK